MLKNRGVLFAIGVTAGLIAAQPIHPLTNNWTNASAETVKEVTVYSSALTEAEVAELDAGLDTSPRPSVCAYFSGGYTCVWPSSLRLRLSDDEIARIIESKGGFDLEDFGPPLQQ